MTDAKLLLTTFYEKTSKSGNVYYTGRLGKARIVLLEDREPSPDGTPTWSLFLTPAGDTARPSAPRQAEPTGPRRDGARPPRNALRKPPPAGAGEPAPNDPIDDLWPGPGGEPEWGP
jgi:hypothetical protein